ncbi:LysM peptidoglycan-binding domain-containing protein [Brevibacillus humidisoli]|uniref:LysM peptidoglycan-binding domain-containing protein n=1 Tax=Brevibacillus humidisoli TaxID=2895522 RepID=UPI001E29D9E3|nr:LysM domain-containing protein [Brevibacillus humidisoli]UFJ43066.1 LysM peptidoglycan-binding domain-containing protein [Brevibacillus humidisoli]
MNYVVRPGDTLNSIAARFGVTVSELIRVNRLTPPFLVYPGQTLYIPTRPDSRPPRPDNNLQGRVERLERQVDRLQRRVDRLDQRVENLNRRVARLEQQR